MRKRDRKVKVIGLVGMLVVGLVAGSLPAEPVSAANGWDIDLNAGSDEAEASSVTISLGAETSSVTLNAKNPSKLQGIIKKTANVTIGATDGYTIKVSGNPNLTSGGNTIQGVSGATTLNQMSNRWGWYYADGNANCSESASYKGMLSTGETVGSGELSSTTTKTITMCFGAKIDASQPGGNYSNTVVISAVAQPKSITTFGGIKTMQEMTADICKAASENDTAYLRDVRDDKSYWVTKLKDGNCWMSQNLDFNISTSNVTMATSDVTSNWTSSSSYPPQVTTTSVTTGSMSGIGTYSWDLGDYVIINPTATTACSSNNTGLSACTGQFVAVGTRTPSTDPNFYKNNGNKTYTATEYDAHYLAGNYYQWNAATAGTGGIIANANAAGSVCPKNWKLPSSATNASTINDGTYAYLLRQYGLASTYSSGGLTGTSSTDQNIYSIVQSPLFFLRGGYVDSGFRNANYAGYYWSSMAHVASGLTRALEPDTPYAWCLAFNSGGSYPSNASIRYYGQSLRCLVPTT